MPGERERIADHALHVGTLFPGALETRAPDPEQEVFGALRRLRHVVLEDVVRV